MKSMKIVPAFVLLLSLPVLAATNLGESALKMVPGGKVIHEKDHEVQVQTKEGTIVEVEFKRNGEFDEASGDVVDKDSFEPGMKLKSLKDVVASMKKAGKNPVGEWNLENSMLKGWHYELEGMENGKSMEYAVDAKTGELRESKVDQ